MGGLKGKAALRMHRACVGREKHCTGLHVWARGSCVSTVGLAEQVLRAYSRNQEQEEKRQEELQRKGLETLAEEEEGLQALAEVVVAPSGAFITPLAPSGGLHQTTRSAGGT